MKPASDLLYHSSRYLQDELMPGFKRSGNFTQWDKIENNHYLYATINKDTAIGMGFCAALEKAFNIFQFAMDGKNITISTGDTINLVDTAKLEVYLYTFPCRDGDGWEKNLNPYNNIKTEYKTTQTIQLDEPAVKVDINKWLADKNVKFTRSVIAVEALDLPLYCRW